MNAAEWAARFAAKPRPTIPAQAHARFTRAVGFHPSKQLGASNRAPQAPTIVQPGMTHRDYRALPAKPVQARVGAVPGMIGGAGYTHSTMPGSQHLYTHKMGPGYQ